MTPESVKLLEAPFVSRVNVFAPEMGIEREEEKAPAEDASCNVEVPETFKLAAVDPSAALELIFNVPALSVVAPLNVLFP